MTFSVVRMEFFLFLSTELPRMAIYRFRVTFEDYDDVYRDIEVRSNQTFEDLHHAIQSAIGFDASKPASFYMSNDNWTKGREITSRELSEEQAAQIASLRKARLCDYIADPHQKIYYLFDFTSKWAFHTELTKISKTEEPGPIIPDVSNLQEKPEAVWHQPGWSPSRTGRL